MHISLLTPAILILILILSAGAQDTRFRTYGPATIGGYTFPYRLGGGSFRDCVLSHTAGVNDSSCAADFFTVGQINDRQTGPYAGLDDGKVFLRWGFLREKRPRRWDCHVGLDLSVTNWFTSTRCYDQMGSDKYEELLRNEGIFRAAQYNLPVGRFGVQRGQEYKRDVLQQIFDSEKNDIPKLIQHAFNANASRAIVFEVGNEPNMHPVMSPELYGWYLKMYADTIRQAALTINKVRPRDTPELEVRIMSAGLWIFDGLPSYIIKGLDQGFHVSFGAIGVQIPVSIKICSIGRSWWRFKFPCGIGYKAVQLTEGTDIKSKFYTDILPYWQNFVAVAGEDTIDIGNLHFYPYLDVDSQYDMQQLLETLRSLSAEVSRSTRSHEVWLTEIGNINPYSAEEAAQKVMSPMLAGLKDRSFRNVTRWYWFENAGNDKKFRLIPGWISDSELKGGVWAAVFGMLEYALVGLTAGLVIIKEPDLSVVEVAKALAFLGRLKEHSPAQGLFAMEGTNQSLTKLGAVYHGFATGQF